METTLKGKLLVLAAAALGITGIGCGDSTPAPPEEGASAESSGGEHSCGANCEGNCGANHNGGCEHGCGANGDGNCGGHAQGAEAPATTEPATTEPATAAPPAQE
jgi:hypothetical protein